MSQQVVSLVYSPTEAPAAFLKFIEQLSKALEKECDAIVFGPEYMTERRETVFTYRRDFVHVKASDAVIVFADHESIDVGIMLREAHFHNVKTLVLKRYERNGKQKQLAPKVLAAAELGELKLVPYCSLTDAVDTAKRFLETVREIYRRQAEQKVA